MEENRVAELLTLVLDQDVPICPALLNSASDFARNELGIELRPFQKDGIAYLISGETGKVLTMVRPPGDGKSLTYIVAGCRLRGITLVFQPTLTLGADQCAKLDEYAEMTTLNVLNLDDYKTPETWNPIVNDLKAMAELPESAVPRLFIILPPQSVANEELPWCKLILELGETGLVRLIVADEFHLWWKQGISFRPEFKKAGKNLIAKVAKKAPLTSVVFFSATCQLPDIALVEAICGVRTSRIIWATPREMSKRGIKIETVCRSNYGNVAKKEIGPVMMMPDKKFISFCDFEKDIDAVSKTLRDLAAELGLGDKVDVVEISGNDSSEQKSFNINLFCGKVTEDEEKELVEMYRGLVATSGCASTGIDPPNVVVVSRKGIPPSASTAFQELGRLRRGHDVVDGSFLYHIAMSVGDYAGLMLRAETAAEATREEKDRNLDEHFEMMKMLVLDNTCIPFAFEKMFGRPGSSDLLENHCGGMCPICSGERNNQCVPFYARALKGALASIFIVDSASQDLSSDFIPKLKDASLTKGVWAYANSTAVRKTIDTHNVEMLTMQLLAAKILLRKFVVSKNKEGESITTVHVRGALNSQEDGYLFSELEAYACIPKVRM
jgi:superfamily II DNA helicase RecQ